MARAYCEDIGAIFTETSAKSDHGVTPLFTDISKLSLAGVGYMP